MRKRRSAILTAATLALGACASLPPMGTSPDPTAAASYASGTSFAAPPAEWPVDGWWRAYHDPQLAALIEAALHGTPTLAQAGARLRKAEASISESKAALWPSLALDANGGEVKES